MRITSGEGTQMTEGPNPERLWSVKWKSAEMDIKGKSGVGRMEGVSGVIARDGRDVATYRAARALADQERKVLTLSGQVRITSLKDPKAVLTCDKVTYTGEDKIIKAQGNIRIESGMGTLTSGSELWATPDLSHAATPDLFRSGR